MKNTKLFVTLGLLSVVVLGSSVFAYRGGRWNNYDSTTTTTQSYYTPGTNVDSPDFVDEDGDGVCDNYATRPMDGSGKKRGRWNR